MVLNISKKIKPGKGEIPEQIKDRTKSLAGIAKMAIKNKKKH